MRTHWVTFVALLYIAQNFAKMPNVLAIRLASGVKTIPEAPRGTINMVALYWSTSRPSKASHSLSVVLLPVLEVISFLYFHGAVVLVVPPTFACPTLSLKSLSFALLLSFSVSKCMHVPFHASVPMSATTVLSIVLPVVLSVLVIPNASRILSHVLCPSSLSLWCLACSFGVASALQTA